MHHKIWLCIILSIALIMKCILYPIDMTKSFYLYKYKYFYIVPFYLSKTIEGKQFNMLIVVHSALYNKIFI